MQCKRCKQQSRSMYCNRCEYLIIEKRVRKDIRVSRYFTKSMRVLVMDKLSLGFLNKHLVDITYKPKSHFGIKNWNEAFINNKLLAFTRKIDRIVVPLTMDDVVGGFIENMFNGLIPKSKTFKIIPIFRCITRDELQILADSKRVRLTGNNNRSEFLSSTKKIHPQAIYSFNKAIAKYK